MAARSTRVTIRNETDQVLTHISDSLQGGEWTEPLTPPGSIAPGAVVWWQSESDGVATGTEGRAAYRIGDSNDQFDIHWDNPYVGTNFYEQGISGPYGLYFEGGKDNNAEAIYSLISNQRLRLPGTSRRSTGSASRTTGRTSTSPRSPSPTRSATSWSVTPPGVLVRHRAGTELGRSPARSR